MPAEARPAATPAGVRRVLISDATSHKAVVLARFVKRHYPAITLLTCDSRPASRLLHTRRSDGHLLLGCGPDRPERYAEALLRLARETAADLVLPMHSLEMDALLPAKSAFGAALGYWGEPDAYAMLHRKDRLHALAEAQGVRVPRRFASPEALVLPAVVKPLALSSARGVHYLVDRASRDRFLATRPDWSGLMVQEHVAGEGCGYSAFAREGQLVVGYGHRRLAEYPVSGGSSVYREGLDDPRMRDAAERLIAATRWSGFVMFEFKRTPANELVLLEANPRVWGSIHQPLAAGVNLLQPLLGAAAVAPRPALRTYLSPLVYVSLLRLMLRGRARPALDFLSHLGSNRADVPLFGDPLGWLSGLLRAR